MPNVGHWHFPIGMISAFHLGCFLQFIPLFPAASLALGGSQWF